MVEIKDSLIRVARNPILKFSKSERFHGPFHILLKENLNFVDDWVDNLLMLRYDSNILVYDYKP